LEDKDRTLAIDVKTQKIVSTWDPACGKDGPRGLAVDPVAATCLSLVPRSQKSSMLGTTAPFFSKVDTGDGVDDMSYVPAYAPSVRSRLHCAAKLTMPV